MNEISACSSDTGEARLISAMAPCRNEVAAIDAFCASVQAQELPPGWHLELLVADGMSDDGTSLKLAEWAERVPWLRLIDNPGRIVSTGLNAALAQARGEVIVRLDIHTEFAPDYVAECLAALRRSGADNVGGPWVARGKGATGRAIAAAFQSRWVVGGARSRDKAYEGEVDTVYLGCWPRASFGRFGGFDENLVRNQDDEHNLRIRLKGGRIWQSGRIRSAYQPRDSLAALFQQQRQYGYWRPFVMRKHGQPGSLRQLVPMAFVAACLVSVVALPWTWGPFAVLALMYGLYLAGASGQAAQQAGDRGLLARLPAVIAAYQVGYGVGTWQGLWDLMRGRRAGASHTRLTR
ncbi:MAG: glycosyltransferase family 2 protein [Ottowia sp.]|uniref:glycosyltransferase family 2 protein n=1 Tax=Ottowia sp. TaxID=1898956 RepID=UPI003C72A1F1